MEHFSETRERRAAPRALALALVAGLLAFPAFASLATASHMPTSGLQIELPALPGGSTQWACAGFATKEPVHVGGACPYGCFTDGNCAIFVTDAAQNRVPFDVEFTGFDNVTILKHSEALGGYVCISYWETPEYGPHYTIIPRVQGPGTVTFAKGVEDEGAYCLY